MSIRVDTFSWIPDAIVVGNRSLGVLAENIPASGDAGPSFLYNDLSLPADNGKEICGRITTWPTNGTLFADETGAFLYTPLSDGVDFFTYQLKVDGVDIGVPTTVDLQVGSPVASIVLTIADTLALFSGLVRPLSAFDQVTTDTSVLFSGRVLPICSFNQITDDIVTTFESNVLPIAAFSAETSNTAFSGSAGTIAAGSFTNQTANIVVSGEAISKPIAIFSTILDNTIFSCGASILGSVDYQILLGDVIFSGGASVRPICIFSQILQGSIVDGGFSVNNAQIGFSIVLEDNNCSFNAEAHTVVYFNIQLENSFFSFGSTYTKLPTYLKYVLPEQQILKLVIN